MTIPFNKNLNKISTYEPGKSGVKNSIKRVIKLSSNESPLEFSKNTIKKIKNIKVNLNRYPDPYCKQLREKVSKVYKVKKNNIIFGNGSDELFFLISYCFLNRKVEGLYSRHGFLIYPIAINAAGAKAVYSKETNFKADVNELIKKSNKNTRVCFIANPNNPTGTYLKKNEIKILRERLPKKCLLVIDSAYSEYVVKDDYCDSLDYAKTRNDIIVTHTFSKIFGIPSVRLGWAYCPAEIVEKLNKIRPSFNINFYAQKIGQYILEDKAFIKKSIKHNLYWKSWVTKKLNAMGIDVLEGVANFILLVLKRKEHVLLLANYLENNNILVRKLNAYKLDNCLRITIGSEKDLKSLVDYIKKFKKEKKIDFI